MIPPIDLDALPPPAKKIVSDGAPQKLQMMAAKGIVPGLKPDALLSVVVLLSQSAVDEVAEQARTTLGKLPDPVLKGALGGDLPEAVILELCRGYTTDQAVLERLVAMKRFPVEAAAHLAEHGDEATVELVATNEERMLAHPHLIELVYLNERARMSTANRLVELAVRHDIELTGIAAWKEIAQSIGSELIAEPSDEPLPEDELFWQQAELAKELTEETSEDDPVVADEEGNEEIEDKFKPLATQLAEMSISEKIRRAMLGTREERMLLIREQNKVVASAAARSPLLQEKDVALIARNRGINVEVLRIIAMNPEFMKSYQVKRNLVENSKTPIAFAAKLVVQLRESDLRKLAKSKNIPNAVQMAARRHLSRRKR